MMAGFGVFFVGMAIGVPIAFVLLITTVALIWLGSDEVLFLAFHQQLFGGLENYGLLALPLFMLVGELMGESGLARRLLDMARVIVGGVRGGLAYVSLMANALMAAILGSAAAQIAMMNRIMTPEMERYGYPRAQAAALSTGGGLLAPILPPSMIFVVYGVLAQVSVGDMFLAGIGPGLIMIAGFFVAIAITQRRAPGAAESSLRAEKSHTAEPLSRRAALLGGLPPLVIPLIILLSITTGIATPTESAALAALAAIGIGVFVYRELTLSRIAAAFMRAAILSGVILLLVAAAQLFSFVVTYQQFPAAVAAWITETAQSPLMFLLLLNLILLVVGMFVDAIAALIVVVPLMLPIATSSYGLDPFHFGVIVCLNLAIGLVTPPVGSGLFIASLSSGVKPEKIAVGVTPFILVAILTLALVVVAPELTTFLI